MSSGVTFFSAHCVTQDLQIGRAIGSGALQCCCTGLSVTSPSPLSSWSSVTAKSQTFSSLYSKLDSILCEVCELSKYHKTSFPSRVCARATEPFHLIHSDIWDPMRISTRNSYQYFVIFIDDFSSTTWLYLMKERSELPHIFRVFISRLLLNMVPLLKFFALIMLVGIFHFLYPHSLLIMALFINPLVLIPPNKMG
ncbi:hypothetical protein Dimus_039140 [Dionaea muscipula]